MDKHVAVSTRLRDSENAPYAAQLFGNAARDHMDKYGSFQSHCLLTEVNARIYKSSSHHDASKVIPGRVQSIENHSLPLLNKDLVC